MRRRKPLPSTFTLIPGDHRPVSDVGRIDTAWTPTKLDLEMLINGVTLCFSSG